MRCVAGLLALMLIAGCRGGDSNQQGPPGGGAASGEEEGEQALQNIPAEDRLAFVQLGVAAGNLRSSAALVRIQNEVSRRDTVTLQRLLKNVRFLSPRDTLLRRVRRWTLAELAEAIRARRSLAAARRSVKTTLAGVDRIVNGLRAYVFVHPEAGALVPE